MSETGENRMKCSDLESWEQLTATREMLIGAIHAELQRSST